MISIYCITNKINGKKYVGKTHLPITSRFSQHIHDALFRPSMNRPLHKAILKYGRENFDIELLCTCSIEESDSKESYYINKLGTYRKGYNVTLGGEGKFSIDYKEVIAVYKSGNSTTETSRIVGCDKSSVLKILDMYNIKRHPRFSVTSGKSKAKAVLQYSLDNKFLRKFNSSEEAAKHIVQERGIKYSKGVSSKIANCAKHKTLSAYEYKWEYE